MQYQLAIHAHMYLCTVLYLGVIVVLLKANTSLWKVFPSFTRLCKPIYFLVLGRSRIMRALNCVILAEKPYLYYQ